MTPPNVPLKRSAMQPTRIAAIYARVSTADQAERGYSLPTQIDACKRLAHELGLTVPPEYIFEDDYTGTSLNRPGLKAVRELVQHGQVEAVLVYDLDRLARKLALQLLLTEECRQSQVDLHIVLMPGEATTPEAQLFAHVRGSIAEYERLKILERTKRGLRGRAQSKKPMGGIVALGYRYIPGDARPKDAANMAAVATPHYVIDEEEAALVKRIFRLYVEEGLSLNAIAALLTQERIPTHRDRRTSGPRDKRAAGVWNPTSVYHILMNETYTGTLYWDKSERLEGKSDPDKKTRWRARPTDEWIAIPVPAIITLELRDQALQQMAHNARLSSRRRKREYLFISGMLRCGQCLGGMAGQTSTRNGSRSYRCKRQRIPGETPCRGVATGVSLEAYVWERVARLLENPMLIVEQVTGLQRQRHTQEDAAARELARVDALLERLDTEGRKWDEAYLNDAIDVHQLKAKKDALAARRASLEAERARFALGMQEIANTPAVSPGNLEAYCQMVKSKLSQMTDVEKRDALMLLDISVTWHRGGTPEIRGSIPTEPGTGDPRACLALNAPYYSKCKAGFVL